MNNQYLLDLIHFKLLLLFIIRRLSFAFSCLLGFFSIADRNNVENELFHIVSSLGVGGNVVVSDFHIFIHKKKVGIDLLNFIL